MVDASSPSSQRRQAGASAEVERKRSKKSSIAAMKIPPAIQQSSSDTPQQSPKVTTRPAAQNPPPAVAPAVQASQVPVPIQFFDTSIHEPTSTSAQPFFPTITSVPAEGVRISAPVHEQQTRSRKSSSSSQKSSKRKQEEVVKEYEGCLEQVFCHYPYKRPLPFMPSRCSRGCWKQSKNSIQWA